MDRNYFVHESSYVDEGAEIGEGTKIWHFCHIHSGAKIGKNCSIGQNVNISGTAAIGDNVRIQNNVSIYDSVIVEDDVFLGPSMVFTNVINPRSFVSRKHEYKTTLVKRGASIGANATIVCGNTVGAYAFVGAGSVVTKDIQDHFMVYGVPAVAKGVVCKCGVKLQAYYSDLESVSGEDSSSGIPSNLICPVCDNLYRFTGTSVLFVREKL